MMENEYYTVTEFISFLNSRINTPGLNVVGEISELKMSVKGHVYPVLKDKETGDILPCTIWGSDYVLSGLELEVGMEVLVKGYPEFYGPFGRLSFHAKTVELVGEGQLKIAYEKLKKKLSEEGLFEGSRKRAIPDFPQRIGIITSTRGEVIHDFTNNLRRSGFKIKVLHCPVEGPGSGPSLTLAVRRFKIEDVDILVIMRGGGSMQSLAGFDNEALVREIVSFPKPVIAGVGHHMDVPLASMAADMARSTPSLVASILNEPWNEARHTLEGSARKVLEGYENGIRERSDLINRTFTRSKGVLTAMIEKNNRNKARIIQALNLIERRLFELREEIIIKKDQTGAKMVNAVKEGLLKVSENSKMITDCYSRALRMCLNKNKDLNRIVSANNPERQLKLGYAIARVRGRIIKSKSGLKRGERMDVMLSDGDIISEIKEIK